MISLIFQHEVGMESVRGLPYVNKSNIGVVMKVVTRAMITIV